MPARIGTNPLDANSSDSSNKPNRLVKRLEASTVDFTDKELRAIKFVVLLIADEDIANLLHVQLLRQAPESEANELFEEICDNILEACEHDKSTSEVETPEGIVDVFASFELVYYQLRMNSLIPDAIYELLQSAVRKSQDRFLKAVATHVGLDIAVQPR